MKKEQGFNCRLDQVPEIIGAPHVRQLMGKHRFQLLRAKSHQCGCRQYYQRPYNSDREWTLNVFGNTETDMPDKAKPFAQAAGALPPTSPRHRPTAPAQTREKTS